MARKSGTPSGAPSGKEGAGGRGNRKKRTGPDAAEPRVPSRSEKAKPEPAAARGSAVGPEMRLEVSSEKTEELTQAETQEAAEEGESSPFTVVGVGASAGGLEASSGLLRNLPVDTGMAFVFVHHLAPEHESLLVEILQRATAMSVEFAKDGERIQPDRVYVAPPNAHVALFHGTFNLMTPEPGPGSRNAIDYFLRSLSEDQRSRSIGVVLSGTGSDGALGLRSIKAQDGITMAQEPSSAAYDGMPRSAIDTGAVDIVLAPEELALELARIARHPLVRPTGPEERTDEAVRDDAKVMDKLFLLLRNASGVDFTYYKPNTVKRRIRRRMVLHQMDELSDYLALLQKDKGEVEELHGDLLINVTGFFREPESFNALKQEVFPNLVKGKGQRAAIRVWVPACSTGEEAYSIAIALTEFIETLTVQPSLQIFATDVSDTSIEKARAGVYPENVEAEISSERLKKFFNRTQSGYQIKKTIRDAVVFAKHDVTRDPPFSRLDLISCRNLLIYLGKVLQRRLIPVFNYALNPNGYLLLGTSESVGDQTDLFTLVDSKFKIYQKKNVPGRPPMDFGFRQYPTRGQERGERAPGAGAGGAANVQREADRITLERYVPPSVLVDDDMRIIQFRGDTTPFLRHASGRASLDLMEMAREGLAAALKSHIAKARQQRSTVRIRGVRFGESGAYSVADVDIVPLPAVDDVLYYLVFFRPPEQPEPGAEGQAKGRRSQGDGAEVEQLRRELGQTREQLRMTTEEKDASTEELRAANEEIESSNEELQSINEELETAKEELQSTNEELTTLNEELQNRNYELLGANDDLRNVLASINVPILILGKDLRIRRYTPSAERVLNVIPSDIGRPITDLKLKIDLPDLGKLVHEVVDNLSTPEQDVKDDKGHEYRLQLRPYRTSDDRIDGVVIAMIDVGPRPAD